MKIKNNKEEISLVGVTVIIADDHQLFAEAIKGILVREGIIVQGICKNGKDAYLLTLEQKPQVLLSDINMTGMEGTHLCMKVKQQLPNTKIIMISMYKEKAVINKAIKNGADAYLSKGSPKSEMIQAIKKCLSGGKYINKNLLKEKDTKNNYSDKFSKIYKLTNREMEVLKLILKEKSNIEISDILDISKRTIETHRTHLKKKLGVSNTIALFKIAIQHNLIKI